MAQPRTDGLSAIDLLGAGARKTYKLVIYQTLYEHIQNLTLRPGTRLVEADLVARFGVSKTPIREALLMLEKDGLVSASPHVGATVTWLTLQEYEQRLFVLDALEQPALERVVERITPERMAHCASLTDAIGRAYEQRDDARYTQLVLQLHSDLFAAAEYPLLTAMVDEIQRSLQRYPKVFVRPFELERRWEFETIVLRMEEIQRRQPSRAAAVVRDGHARLLGAAKRRVESGDPSVMPFLRPNPQ